MRRTLRVFRAEIMSPWRQLATRAGINQETTGNGAVGKLMALTSIFPSGVKIGETAILCTSR